MGRVTCHNSYINWSPPIPFTLSLVSSISSSSSPIRFRQHHKPFLHLSNNPTTQFTMRFSTLAIILASATSILAAPGAERRCEECDEETKGYGGPPPPPSPEFGGPPPPPSPGFGGPPPPPMPYFVPPPYYPTPFSAPSPFSGGESGSPCSGLESTPLCCQLDVEGIVDTPCESRTSAPHLPFSSPTLGACLALPSSCRREDKQKLTGSMYS